MPCALRNVYVIPPPMSRPSTLLSKFSITPILSLTLAPPKIATKGRFDRFEAAIRRVKHLPARDIVSAVHDDMVAFAPPKDDVSLVVIKRS
jgi:hypothetical protein